MYVPQFLFSVIFLSLPALSLTSVAPPISLQTTPTIHVDALTPPLSAVALLVVDIPPAQALLDISVTASLSLPLDNNVNLKSLFK